MSEILRGDGLGHAYGGRDVLSDVDLTFPAAGITAVVGPNGAGKSTLLKALARLVAPDRGTVYIDGRALTTLSSAQIARRLAVLPQGPVAPDGLTVGALVEQGRFPHVGGLRMLGRQDHASVRAALADTGMTAFAERPLTELSGGERQRAWIALALAQDTDLLLLDEPTTFLDLRFQLEILELVVRLNRVRGTTIVMVLHDLNHAARHADRVVVMRDGLIVADGPPAAVITAGLVRDVFGVHATMIADPVDGRPVCVARRTVAAGEHPADGAPAHRAREPATSPRA